MPLPARIPRSVPRPKREKRPGDSRAHLDWIKTLPCVLCGQPADDPHHLLGNMDGLPKGMGRKNEDRWALPTCRRDHNRAHAAGNDEAFLASHGIDGRAVAAALWRFSGDTEKAMQVIYKARFR